MKAFARPNAFLDDLLKPENQSVILSRIRRKAVFVPDEDLIRHTDPKTGEQYFTFLWSIGNAPADAYIEIEIDRCTPSNPLPRKSRLHNHDFFEVVYIYRGVCACTVSGNTVELYAGDICLYNLQAIHSITKLTEDAVIFNILIKQELFLTSCREMMSQNDLLTGFYLNSIYNIDRPVCRLVLKPNPRFTCEELAQKMICIYYGNGNMRQDRLKAMMMLLFAEITDQYRSECTGNTAEANGQDSQLTEILSYIHQNIADITHDMLAQHLGYSTRTLQRILRTQYDTSYTGILRHIRAGEACRLLDHSELSCCEIARMIGYSDHSAFERAFKREFKLTPNEYRKRYMK